MTATYEELWVQERPRLTALAYRILGSWHDAEDVVAQSWPRLAGQEVLDRPQAWLTTVVTRLAIDAGRRARARRETYAGEWLPEPVATDRLPEEIAQTRSLLGLALLRLMDRLDPEDRAIYVLREAFDVPYAEIAECVGRTPAACRQVVSRASATLRADRDAGSWDALRSGASATEDQRLLTALVASVSAGDVAGAVRLVSRDCVLWGDGGGVTRTAPKPIIGGDKVVRFLVGVARWATAPVEVLEVNGGAGLLFCSDAGRYLFVLEHVAGRVTGIQVQANPDKLSFAQPRTAGP